MLTPEVLALGARAGALLRERGDTIALAEGSSGGLVSTALLAVPGASAYFRGSCVIYTAAAYRGFLAGAVEAPTGMRGATEVFAAHLADAVSMRLDATWGLAEAGAAGPPNPYGDPAGHSWVAVGGRRRLTRHVLTGLDGRADNMTAFAAAALTLLLDVLGDS